MANFCECEQVSSVFLKILLEIIFSVFVALIFIQCTEITCFCLVQIDLCVKVLSDIMELLFRNDVGPTIHDITEMMLTVLRTAIQTSIAMDRENSSVVSIQAIGIYGL